MKTLPFRALACAGGLLLSRSVVHAQTPAAPAVSDDKTVKLDSFTVTTDRDVGYGSTNSQGASRINIALQDIPQSVIEVNQQIIKDTGATEFLTALRFVSDVNVASGPLNGQFSIRGINVTGAILRDGLPEGAILSGIQFFDLAPFDRLEVIKGPEGSLYGSQAIGGIVNRVSKQPLGVAQYDLQGMITTSNGHQIVREQADATGPIDKAGKWRYRVIAADSDGRTWYNREYARVVFTPIVTFNPTADLKFWARYEYEYGNVANVASTWVADKKGQIDTFIPRDDVSGDPWESQKLWKQYWEAGAEDHFFDGHLTSRLTWRLSQDNRTHYRYIESTAGGVKFYDKLGNLLGTDQTASIDFSDPSIFGSITQNRQYAPENQTNRQPALYWDNAADFKIGPASNKLIAYYGYTTLDSDNIRWVSTVAATPVFDYLHPVYTAVFNPNQVPLSVSVNTVTLGRAYDFGAQDNIGFFDQRLIFVTGFRYDTSQSQSFDYLKSVYSNNEALAHTYKEGVVVKPIQGISLFYTYTQTFNPQFGSYFLYPTLQVLPKDNQLGAMNEYGFKLDMFNAKLVTTASYFDITLNNNLGTGPTINGTPTSIPLGSVRSTGWEMDTAVVPINNVTLLAGIGFITSKTATGLYTQYAGEGFNFRALAKYSVPHGFAKGLSIGAGYEYTNKRAGDAADDFFLPAFGIWNAFASYNVGPRWSLQVNVDNLADKVYAASSPQALLIYPGDPRTTKFSVQFHF